MSDYKLAEQSRKLAACQRVMDLIDTYVERPNAGNRLSILDALLELAAHEAEQQAPPYTAPKLRALIDRVAEQQAGEAVAWHVVDADGQLMHAAGWKAAAHEHINDALNEYGIEEAAKWRVIPVFTHPQQPLSDRQLRTILTGSPTGYITETVRGIAVDVQNALLGITKDTK